MIKLVVDDPRTNCACQAVAHQTVAQREQFEETNLYMQVSNTKTLEEIKGDISLNLRRIRTSRGISQEKLALDSGVDRTFVSKIERAVGNPSIEVLLRLANQLDTTVVELLKPPPSYF